MVYYRRLKIAGATYFFTVTLRDRKSNILIKHIELLKLSMKRVQQQSPYTTNAIVILPDHLHVIWTLPKGDEDFSMRWMKIKCFFTRYLIKNGFRLNKDSRGEYTLWQRRFWEHMIRNDKDYENHVNYIHYNPVKHGLAKQPRDWPYSSFHKFVRLGILPANWSDNCELGYHTGKGSE